VRRYALLSLIFLFVEALLGAGLVMFRYVAKDQSAGRVWYLSAHLINTMLLLAALTATAWLASSALKSSGGAIRIRSASGRMLGAVFVTVAVSVTGVIAAMGDTLFPASSITGGMQQDFSNASSVLLRLRLLHPVMAVLGAGYLIWVAAGVLRSSTEGSPARKAAARVTGIVVFQVAVGAINISLLAPMWMQIIHLLIADLVWIALVLLLLETLRTDGRTTQGEASLTQPRTEERAAEISQSGR
jgi:cytochrome c oxidase assembly protein subunit 15